MISAIAGTAGLALPAKVAARNTAVKPTVLIEQTLLKSKPGLREDLIRFIELNWFALDRMATEQGLFTGYWMAENDSPDAEWDLVVCVSYPHEQGYNHPPTKAAFDKLRADRKSVAVNGRKLPALGDIIGNQSLMLRAGRAAISIA
jgi:hypothetical protein